MLEKILLWIAQAVISWLAQKAQTSAIDLYNSIQDENKFNDTNQTNVEKYNAAKDRLEKLMQLKICLIAFSLAGCKSLSEFPAKTVWEVDTTYGVCGEYKITNTEKMTVNHVKDWPIEKCNGVFGFATEDIGKVFRWSEKAQSYVKQNCK